MIINTKDTLVLDDNNEYIVVGKTSYENKQYYCLMDINSYETNFDFINDDNLKFCYQDNDEMVEVLDEELVSELLSLFGKDVKDS